MRFTQHVKTDRKARLDLKDKKILFWLAENARMPHARIAKKVGLSKDAVKYRIRNLEKEGVIQGYLSIIEISKLGYNTYHIFLRLKQVDRETRSKLIGLFKGHPMVKAVIEFSGKYDFEIGLASRTVEELDETVTGILDNASRHLQDYMILAISRYYLRRVFPRSFLDLEKDARAREPGTRPKTDGADLRILKRLSEDATLPLHELGRSAGLSPDAASYRMRKLMKEEIVVRHVPIINYSALDYTVYAVFMNINNLDSTKARTLEQFLRTSKSALWAVKTIGKYNLLMYICTRKSDELHQELIRLRELFSEDIRDYETLVMYEEYKYTYYPMDGGNEA